jgi:hypothetical protein
MIDSSALPSSISLVCIGDILRRERHCVAPEDKICSKATNAIDAHICQLVPAALGTTFGCPLCRTEHD